MVSNNKAGRLVAHGRPAFAVNNMLNAPIGASFGCGGLTGSLSPHPTSTTERRKIAPDVFAIRSRVAVRAGSRQTIVPVCEINEARFVDRDRVEVIRRIIAARRREDDVSPEGVSGEIESERIQSYAATAAKHAVLVVRRDVVAKNEARTRRAVGDNERAALEDRVVIESNVDRPPDKLREPAVSRPVGGAAPFIAVNVVNQIVLDQDSLRRLARRGAVRPRDVEATARMSQDVVGESHVLSRRLRRRPILAARREEDGEAILRVRPVVFEDVLVYEQSLGVFQFEKILDRPGHSGVSGMAFLPRERLIDVVQSELDVGGDHVLNRRLGPTEHNVLPRAFQVVVDDFERPRPVPTADGLRVGADLVDVGDVRIDYRRAGGIDHYAAPDITAGVAVNIAAVDDQVVRRLRQRSLIAAE